MINYIIQIILFQLLFLAVYDLFLSKETFFTKNRLYLIVTVILSFVLPLLRITILQKTVFQEYAVLLPEVVLSPQKVIEQSSWYENINYLQMFFKIGVFVFSIIFILKLSAILRLIFRNEIHPKNNYNLVWLPKSSKAFSFFNYIFLGREIPSEKQQKIILHELVHSKQKHSLDLLFFELLKIVMWFNPIIYLYQKRIALLHEFISDEVVTKNEEKTTYINGLLSEIFQVEHISFINGFYKHSFIKKRIIMMTKQQSKQIKQVKYLLLIPVLASMILYVSCSQENEIDKEEQSIEEILETVKTSPKILRKKEVITELEEIVEKAKNEMYKTGNFTDEEIEIIDEDIPFSLVDKSPTFPECSEGDKNCFNKSVQKFIGKNFNTKLIETLQLPSGKQRIFIQFKIGTDGIANNIKVRAPHPDLKKEAIRLVELLPKFKPAEQNGSVVSVKYVLPITFKVY